MNEANLFELLQQLGAPALAALVTVWMVGHLGLQAAKMVLDRRQRARASETVAKAVHQTGCQYPEDLVDGTRRALVLQERIAEEQAHTAGRMEAAIRQLIEAMDRREERQANTLQILSNSLATLAAEIRTSNERRRSAR
jgi:hypothetical protein